MRGDELRDHAAKLLKARYGNALIEHKVGGKDADVFFTMRYPGGAPLKIAVEAKDWKKLHSSDITKMYAEYAPAFEKKDIDSLWIVTKLPLRAEQAETVQAFGIKLRLFTLDSLYNEIVDFSDYLRFLVADFRKDGLNEYYIEPRSTDGMLVHDELIAPWLDNSTAAPIAIVAGYGAGKTSYAKFLAQRLAQRALDDVTAPKPILLQLGSLTRQQSIRSLINSLYSDDFSVDGYKYPIFQMLLEQGQFVVILDGFDEMKHAMKRRDIVSNFDNIRQFMKNTKSKYLLLGRPDPFLSIDDEAALHPKLSIGSQQISDLTSVHFSITYLDEFTDNELERFLSGFLTRSTRERASDFSSDAEQKDWVRGRVIEIQNKKVGEILKKPVHAKMLAILAASPSWQISASTEYDLYHHFVQEFLHRELTEKPARAVIGEDDRLAFMQRIAWWLWTERKTISFTVDQVPNHIINTVKAHFEEGEREEVILREMLIGSILECRTKAELVTQKDAYSFYFPHRSYWEYLVAEYVASRAFVSADIPALMRGFGGQVLQFLYERSSRDFVPRLFDLLQDTKGALDASFFRNLAKIVQWRTEEFGERILAEAGLGNLRIITMAAATGGISFDKFRGILESIRANTDLAVQGTVTLYANMYYAMVESSADRRDARYYVGSLNCRFLRRSLDQVGIDRFIDEQNRLKSTIAAGARVPQDILAFINVTRASIKEGEAYLLFDSREIVLALSQSRSRIDRLNFGQDAFPARAAVQITVADFVEKWVKPEQRNKYRGVLSHPLGEVRKG